MKIAVTGKGGSGKTVVAGTIARALATADMDVVAIDADHDPDLAVSLGRGRDASVPAMPDEFLDPVETEAEGQSWELTRAPRALIEEFGVSAPDGVTLLRAGAVTAGAGAFGYSRVTIFTMLSDLETAADEVMLLDMAAGLDAPGMTDAVDVALQVVEPTSTSLDTLGTLAGFTDKYDVPDVRVIANDVRSDRELGLIEDYCAAHDLDVARVIPHDDAVREAEQVGAAPIEHADGGPAVRAIRDLADDLRATHE